MDTNCCMIRGGCCRILNRGFVDIVCRVREISVHILRKQALDILGKQVLDKLSHLSGENQESSEPYPEDTDTKKSHSKIELKDRVKILLQRIAERQSRDRGKSETRRNRSYLCCAWNRGIFWMIILYAPQVFISSD